MVEKEYHVFTRTSKRRSRRGQEGHCLQADECQQCASNVRTLRLLLMPSFDGYHCVAEQQQCRAGAVVGGVWQISPIITHHISLRNAALPAWEPHNNQPATSTDWLIRVLPIEFQPYFDADILSTLLKKFLQQESNSFPLDTFVRLAESKAKQSKLKDTRLPVLLLHKTMDIVDHRRCPPLPWCPAWWCSPPRSMSWRASEVRARVSVPHLHLWFLPTRGVSPGSPVMIRASISPHHQLLRCHN